MFLQLASLFGAPSPIGASDPNLIFQVSPAQLSRWLDEAWAAGGRVPPILGEPNKPPFLGDLQTIPNHQLPKELRVARPSGISTADSEKFSGVPGPETDATLPFIWDHLVYAYLVESTGVFEIFTEVVRRLVVGETLVTLDAAANQWLRATEELFFRDPPLFGINGVVSELRPHARANRRNAYWRMLGMDLPHQVPTRWNTGGEAGWKADVGPGVNADFRAKWTELLRQVWLGIEHGSNSSGPRPTDPTFLVLLCEALRDMMNNRRRGGQLAREEFSYVTAMSWFHMTVNTNSPIVAGLQAIATSPADRLAAIGQRVGMNPAARTRELLELAAPMSRILRAIEFGFFSTPAKAEQLFLDATLKNEMTNIIDNWQSATGERVKERPVGTVPGQPLRVPIPASNNGAAARVTTNGARV